MKRPKVMITNDDGIYAPGIGLLWKTLYEADVADLFLVAPLTERSGTGAAITWDRPILVQKIQWQENASAWAIDGTPADCIKMGIRIVLNSPPDFIISGINAGSNAGRNVLHSGTIGAVIEGVLRGIPGLAFSCQDAQNPNYHVAQKYILPFFHYLMHHPLPPGSFLNVNFPNSEDIQGVKLTRQGKGRWAEDPFLHFETQDGPTYWLGGKPEEHNEEEECDIAFLHKGFITAVPIHVHELTDLKELKKREHEFERVFLVHKS